MLFVLDETAANERGQGVANRTVAVASYLQVRASRGPLLEATQDQLWLSEGRQNLLRNVPARWQAGVEVLRQGGVADIKDPTTLYTNTFIDKVLKA